MYGPALTKPMYQEFRAQVPAAVHSCPVSAIPKASGNDKLAPFDPGYRVNV